MVWILDQNDEGLYILDHDTKGSLKDLTLEDLDLLAAMFDDEVIDAETDLCEDEDDLEWMTSLTPMGRGERSK